MHALPDVGEQSARGLHRVLPDVGVDVGGCRRWLVRPHGRAVDLVVDPAGIRAVADPTEIQRSALGFHALRLVPSMPLVEHRLDRPLVNRVVAQREPIGRILRTEGDHPHDGRPAVDAAGGRKVRDGYHVALPALLTSEVEGRADSQHRPALLLAVGWRPFDGQEHQLALCSVGISTNPEYRPLATHRSRGSLLLAGPPVGLDQRAHQPVHRRSVGDRHRRRQLVVRTVLGLRVIGLGISALLLTSRDVREVVPGIADQKVGQADLHVVDEVALAALDQPVEDARRSKFLGDARPFVVVVVVGHEVDRHRQGVQVVHDLPLAARPHAPDRAVPLRLHGLAEGLSPRTFRLLE